MINETGSTKQKVLSILRGSSDSVSGETLAQETGLSRVAVWKAVQSLQQSGYNIVSSRKGYVLQEDLKDSLYPWEFGAEESIYEHYSTTDSTMTQAWTIATSGAMQDGQIKVVSTDVQTNGKGRGCHDWQTTEGSLAFTLVLKDVFPVVSSHRYLMASQIALARTLEEHSGRNFVLRWPNDIWSEKGKVAGVLDEYKVSGGYCQFINLGIGVNLSSVPPLPFVDRVFDRSADGNRKSILAGFVKAFEEEIKFLRCQDETLERHWNDLCCDKDKSVRIDGEEMVFKKVNSYGWAEMDKDGTPFSFAPGTVRFVKGV